MIQPFILPFLRSFDFDLVFIHFTFKCNYITGTENKQQKKTLIQINYFKMAANKIIKIIEMIFVKFIILNCQMV